MPAVPPLQDPNLPRSVSLSAWCLGMDDEENLVRTRDLRLTRDAIIDKR